MPGAKRAKGVSSTKRLHGRAFSAHSIAGHLVSQIFDPKRTKSQKHTAAMNFYDVPRAQVKKDGLERKRQGLGLSRAVHLK